MKLQKATAIILAIAGVIFLGFAVKVSFGESYSATAKNTYKYIPFTWNRNANENAPSSKLHQRASKYRIKLHGSSDSDAHMPNIKRLVEASSSQSLEINGKTTVSENTMGTITLDGKAVKESDIDELYCSDFNVALPGDSNSDVKDPNKVLYQKYNIEDSGYFGKDEAAKLRAIVLNAYPKKTDATVKADIEKWCGANANKCTGYSADALTSERLLTGAQWAIWNIANSSNYYCKNETSSDLCNTGAVLELESSIGASDKSTITAIKNYYENLEPIPLNSNNVANGIIEFGNIDTEVKVIDGEKRLEVKIPVTSSGAELTDVQAKFTLEGKEITPISGVEVGNNTILYTLVTDAQPGAEIKVHITAKQKGITGPFLYKPSNRKEAQILVGNSVNDVLDLEDSKTFNVPQENTTTLTINKTVKGKEGFLPAGIKIRVTGPGLDETFVTEEGKNKVIKINSAGAYKIEELEAPKGYIISDPIEFDVTEVDLAAGGKGVTILKTIENDYTKVSFSKVDITNKKELPGAKLELFDSEGKLVTSWTSTNKPHIIEMLEPGNYKLKETIAPKGYQLSTETVEFEVSETGEVQSVVMNNAPYIEVPKTALDKSYIIYLIGGIVLLAGSGLLIYYGKKNKKRINRLTIKYLLYLGFILIVVGVILLMSDYIYTKKIKVFEDMNYKIYINTTKSKTIETGKVEDESSVKKTQTYNASQIKSQAKDNYQSGVYDYVAMVEIPKIGLKRGLVPKNSRSNNVDRNIMTLKESTYPNVEKGNLILAAHSGSGYISFFKHLYKLKIKDRVNVYYKNVKYTYEISNIYLQDKVGRLLIYRDSSKTTLTLITCTKNNKKKQTVYIAELVSKVGY